MHRRSVFLSALLLLLSACAGDDPLNAPESEIDVHGHYAFGLEVASLHACDVDEVWWVEDPAGLLAGYNDVAEQEFEGVYVRLRGIRSPLGEYGHVGAYDRTFEVTGLYEMRTAGPDDCP
ncbi:MAG: hypothetical protein ACYSWU_22875 [Planctomycetota bacterium]|jgi:hypothetical protein